MPGMGEGSPRDGFGILALDAAAQRGMPGENISDTERFPRTGPGVSVPLVL